MNELVNFKKIDIIKEMIKEKEQNIDNKTDYDNIAVGDITMDYFYEYIEPILLELNDNGIVEYDKTQIKTNSGTRRVYLKAISFIRETLVAKDDDNNDTKFSSNDNGNKNMFLMFDLDKYRQLCDEKDNYFLASNDTKPKKEFAQKIKEIFEYEYKVITYSEDYLKPLLSNLGKSNKIRYFVNPKNEEEKYINYSIESILISIIHTFFYRKEPIGEQGSIINIIDNGSDSDKKQLAWTLYFDIFSQQYTDEDLEIMYQNMRAYANNRNKYGRFDFSNYNKVITTIFDIK